MEEFIFKKDKREFIYTLKDFLESFVMINFC